MAISDISVFPATADLVDSPVIRCIHPGPSDLISFSSTRSEGLLSGMG